MLCYGDYPKLATRCLESIVSRATSDAVAEIVVICNVVSTETTLEINRIRREMAQVPVRVIYHLENIRKYPAMRRVFHYMSPITTPYVMWFDDDSCIRPEAPSTFFVELAELMVGHDVKMNGQLWHYALSPNQQRWVPTQPWGQARPVPSKIAFCQGGWWIMATDLIKEADWPPANFSHSGGDVMTGVMLHQRGIGSHQIWHQYVAINANNDKLRNSVGPTRGVNKKQEPPIGSDYRGAT